MSDLFGSKPSVMPLPALPDSILTPPTPPSPNSPEAKQAAERIQRQNAARLGRQATILTSPGGLPPVTGLQPTGYTGASILGS